MAPDRLVVPVQPDGNYPDIEAVKKHSDAVVCSAVSSLFTSRHGQRTQPVVAPGWENAAAESKQISGLATPRVFCWLLAAQDVCASVQVL
jgi:hypothetical protein